DDPENQSKFTITPEQYTGRPLEDEWRMLRVEFHDLDSTESIWGLTPWPAKIVDEAGNTDTFETHEATGSIRSSAEKINLFAYYTGAPATIEYSYHNWSQDNPGCHAAKVTAYSYQP